MNLPIAAFLFELNAKKRCIKRTLLRNEHDGFRDEQRCKANKNIPIVI